MKRSNFSEEQIACALRLVDAGEHELAARDRRIDDRRVAPR